MAGLKTVHAGDSVIITGFIEKVGGGVPDLTGVTVSVHIRLKNAVRGVLYQMGADDSFFIDANTGMFACRVPGTDTEQWPILPVPPGQGNAFPDIRFTFPNGSDDYRITCECPEFLVVA